MPVENTGDSNSKDISAGGVKVEVTESIKPNTVLWLEISLPNETDPLEAKGEVIWQEKISNSERIRYEMGVKFLEMNLNDRTRLNKYLYLSLHNKFEQKTN
jgi:c-di-GMP-binding flagellar brake protein YcgR